jgi:uncharacterized membrane protein
MERPSGSTNFVERLPHRFFLALALLIAVLSFWAATRHMSHSVWYDESQTADIGHQRTLTGVTLAAMRERPYPPLFFYAVHASLHFWDNEMGLRLPAAFFGALAIVAVFYLGRKLADGPTGALAALLFALTPGNFRYFADGNPYTLLALLSALSMLYAFRAAHSDRVADWAVYAFFALLGLATHALFVFHVVAQFCGAIYLMASVEGEPRRSYKRPLAAFSTLGILWLLWVAAYRAHQGVGGHIDLPRLPHAGTLFAIAGMFVGPVSWGHLAQLGLWMLLAATGALALFLQSRRVFWFMAIVSTVSLVPIALFVKATLPYVAYRYGLGVFPLACIVAAYAPKLRVRGEASGWFCRPVAAKGAAYAVLAAYCIPGVIFLANANATAFENQNWRDAARYVDSRAKSTDAIVLVHSWDTAPFHYYYRGGADCITAADASDVPNLVSKAMARPGAPGRTVWIIAGMFGNENSFVARYTEFLKRDIPGQTERFIRALNERGLSAEQVVKFHRILIARVTAGSAPAPPPSH